MSADPPVYNVDPADLDNDTNPTTAWTLGEHLPDEVAAKLREIGRGA